MRITWIIRLANPQCNNKMDCVEDNTLTFNQGVTGSRPVRPTKASKPSLLGIIKKNQGVKTLGQPTP